MKEELIRVAGASDGKLLKSIYLSVYKGNILGALFTNMQECQSLIDLLSGKEKFAAGRICYREERVTAGAAKELFLESCMLIESSNILIENMTVHENVHVIGNKKLEFFIRQSKSEAWLKRLFAQFNIRIPVNKQVKKLTHFEKMTVALIKAYALNKAIVLLKNITVFLTRSEMDGIMNLIRQLKGKGMSFVFFETYEDFPFEYMDTLLIIRDGRTVGAFRPDELDKRKVRAVFAEKKEDKALDSISMREFEVPRTGGVALRFCDVCTDALAHVSFEVRHGEIARLLYPDYRSYEHVIALLKGERQPRSGSIYLHRKEYGKRPRAGGAPGEIGFVEENPSRNMLFYEMSVLDNISLSMARKVTGMWMKKNYLKSIMSRVENIIGREMLDRPLLMLSPQELQKVIYCKWLLYAPSVVICLKPFSTVDVQTRHVTEQMIRLLAERGIAVLIVSSNRSELELMDGVSFSI
ncbi:MAG TPA: hypothetical protein DEB31_08880 [Clostridiales bacterium]|nr:hypothetical protein [Clostridiales bacterium]